jgi:hypothetical protein
MASEAIETAIYKMSYQTGDSTQQLKAARDAAAGLVTESEKLAVSEEKVTRATRTQADGMERLLGQLDKRVASEQRLSRTIEQVNRLQAEGIGSTNQAAQAIALAEEKHRKFVAANDNSVSAVGRFNSVLQTANGYLGAFGLALGVGAVLSFAKNVFESTAALSEQAEQIGVSVEGLQAYRGELSEAGIKVEQTDLLLTKFNRNLGEAAQGNKTVLEAFGRLGLSGNDLAGGPEAVLPKVAAALLTIEDSSQRAAIEADLFGKTGQRLESALIRLTQSSSELIDKQKELGHVLGEDVAKSADDAADALDRWWNSFKTGAAQGTFNVITGIYGTFSAIGDKIQWIQEHTPDWLTGTNGALTRGQPGQSLPQSPAPRDNIGFPNLNLPLPKIDLEDTKNKVDALLKEADARRQAAIALNDYIEKLQTKVDLGQVDKITQESQSAVIDAARAYNEKLVESEQAVINTYGQARDFLEKLSPATMRLIDARNAEREAAEREKQKIDAVSASLAANRKEMDKLADSYQKSIEQRINASLPGALEKNASQLLYGMTPREKEEADTIDRIVQGYEDRARLAGMSRSEAEAESVILREQERQGKDLSDIDKQRIRNGAQLLDEMERQRDVAEDMRGSFSQFFDNVLEHGKLSFGSLWDSIKSSFSRMLADMASEALVKPIIMPIVQSAFGSLGLGGGGGGGLAGLAQFGSSLAGGGSPLGGFGSLGSLGGLFGNSSGGILNAAGADGLSTLNVTPQIFGTGIGGAGGLLGSFGGGFSLGNVGTMGAGLGGFLGFGDGLSTVAVTPQIFGTGIASGGGGMLGGLGGLGGAASFLGPGFIGAGIGSMTGGLFGGGGNGGVGASIGGAIGGIAGSFLGPIGTVLGSALGGALGGLVDGKPSNFTGWASFNKDFSLNTGAPSGDKPNQQTVQMAQSAGQAVSSAAMLLEKAGIDLTNNIQRIEIGQRDATRLRLDNGSAVTVGGKGDVQGAVSGTLDYLLKSATSTDEVTQKIIDSYRNAGKLTSQYTDSLLQDVQSVKQLMSLVGDDKEPLTQAEQALKQINDQFGAIIAKFKSLGIATADIEAQQQRAIAAGEGLQRRQPAAIDQITNPVLAAWNQLMDAQKNREKEAQALGAITALLQRRNALEQEQFLLQLDSTQRKALEALIGLSETLAIKIADAQAAALDAVSKQLDLARRAVTDYANASAALDKARSAFLVGPLSDLNPLGNTQPREASSRTCSRKARAAMSHRSTPCRRQHRPSSPNRSTSMRRPRLTVRTSISCRSCSMMLRSCQARAPQQPISRFPSSTAFAMRSRSRVRMRSICKRRSISCARSPAAAQRMSSTACKS